MDLNFYVQVQLAVFDVFRNLCRCIGKFSLISHVICKILLTKQTYIVSQALQARARHCRDIGLDNLI